MEKTLKGGLIVLAGVMLAIIAALEANAAANLKITKATATSTLDSAKKTQAVFKLNRKINYETSVSAESIGRDIIRNSWKSRLQVKKNGVWKNVRKIGFSYDAKKFSLISKEDGVSKAVMTGTKTLTIKNLKRKTSYRFVWRISDGAGTKTVSKCFKTL